MSSPHEVVIRQLREHELGEADRIFRTAFGTFIGLANPLAFGGDADYVRTRWRADPAATLAAELDGRLVGSNFLTRWGRFAFFGPLTVRPDHWNRGIARRLLDATMERFATWDVDHARLFTFPDSPRHVALYQRYGFQPRGATLVLGRAVEAERPEQAADRDGMGALDEVAGLTHELFPGLDVRREIEATHAQALGSTVLLREAGRLVGLAVCHCGAGTEAGSDTCYVKFGAVRPGPGAAHRLGRLLDACQTLAAECGLGQLLAGVNVTRTGALAALTARGFRRVLQGLAMARPDEPAYDRPDAFVLDDWR